ncbi:hypothetical protein Mgra_00003846 [Meloidogyne graminicola]|uniref:Uncharacterized protein n=1 Tax=Meloidogyne graminicola TaxID=189291 RepID=A0A8S9ZTZ6_9BILA|nr:hypothetical protein Mgra_00003846 [Meloidogyne graminicola]
MSTNFILAFIFTFFITTQQQNDQNIINRKEENSNLLFVPIMTKNTADYIKLIKMLRRPVITNSADAEMFNYKIMSDILDGRGKRQLASEENIFTPDNRIQREFTEKRFSRIGGNIMMGR